MSNTFALKIYELAARIPRGKVATYGQLARLAGHPGAARAVGMCMKQNPDRVVVPCHRVVASNGALTGYAFGKGVPTKKEMLIEEGVCFNGECVDLRSSQWNPEASEK